MTTARQIWPHTEAMTWTATSGHHPGTDDVTQHTYNVTTSTVLLAPDVTPTLWQLVRFLVIVVVSLLTNLLIVVTIKRSPRLQSLVYFYLSSLAIMDIIDSLIVMPVAFARPLLNEFTIFSGWCQCWQTVLFGLAAGTLVHIIITTLHCYLMLGTPLRYHKYSQSIHAILQVGMGWIIPALLSIPAIVVLVEKHFPAEDIPGWECAPPDAAYMSAALGPMYYVPIIIAVVLLVLLAFQVKRRGHMSDQLQCVLPGLAYSNGVVHPENDPKEAEKSRSKKIKERKPTGRRSKLRMWKKPVTNVESTRTIASECGAGMSDDCNSISETASQDDDPSIDMGKDMFVAEVHSTDSDSNNILDNNGDMSIDSREGSPLSCDDSSDYDNARPIERPKSDKSCDYDNVTPTADYENCSTNSDYENNGTCSDYENGSTKSDYENTANSDDYENACASSDYENPSCSSDYENATSGSDYENATSGSDYENGISSTACENADSSFEYEKGSPNSEEESKILERFSEIGDTCQTQAKGKCGKEKLNEPLDEMDVHLTLETVELLNKECGIAGSDNPAYSQDESETPLADSIQVKHKSNDTQEQVAEDQIDGNSQHSSSGGESGECGIQGPRRSILRRDGSRRVSKKVQFAIPESQSNEGKSASRIRRRPTGLRRRNRNSSVVNAINNCSIKHITNGTVSMITNGVTTIPPSTFEYMIQVHRNQGLKLSRKVRNQQAHFIVLCAMLVVHGILTLPYMFTYTVLTLCHSCRTVLPNSVATAFEWMHHTSSSVNLLLYILFNAEFRESLANLCGCK